MSLIALKLSLGELMSDVGHRLDQHDLIVIEIEWLDSYLGKILLSRDGLELWVSQRMRGFQFSILLIFNHDLFISENMKWLCLDNKLTILNEFRSEVQWYNIFII
jgi:hypothetical protein